MIVSCPSCAAKYQYDENRFGVSQVKKLRCSKCENVFEVARPAALDEVGQATNNVLPRKVEETTKQFELEKMQAQIADSELPQLAPLPPNKRYSLAVILGAGAGQIHAVVKPRTILGRGASVDLQLQDSEISRQHTMLEIHGESATLTDLGSTNGTFVDGVRIQKAALESHQEFSLGTSTLMFIVTEVNDPSIP